MSSPIPGVFATLARLPELSRQTRKAVTVNLIGSFVAFWLLGIVAALLAPDLSGFAASTAGSGTEESSLAQQMKSLLTVSSGRVALLILLSLVVWAVVMPMLMSKLAVGRFRDLLAGESELEDARMLRFTPREWHFFGRAFLWQLRVLGIGLLIVIGAGVASWLLTFIMSPLGALFTVGAMILIVFSGFYLPSIYCMIFPAAALDYPLTFRDSVRMTAPLRSTLMWRHAAMDLLMIVLSIATSLIQMIIELLLNLFGVQSIVLSPVFSALAYGVMTVIFVLICTEIYAAAWRAVSPAADTA